MSDAPELYFVSIGQEPPPWLRPSALGVCLTGTPDSLFLVFHEEFIGTERATIVAGEYRIGLKLYRSSRVCGLAWTLSGDALGMMGYADYSLSLVRRRYGGDVVDQFRESARSASLADSPGHGLMVRLVFVDPDDGLVFGLRLFALPRLFSDRFLAGVLETEYQDEEAAAERVAELCSNGLAAWGASMPGVASAGHDIELSDGEWTRLVRKDRERRRDRR
jgi:hypothetical protein